jgi:uncharacterized protein YcfL
MERKPQKFKKGNRKMRKILFLIILNICFIACSNNEDLEETESNTSITINEEITWSQGIGSTPEEFVINWNKLIDSISNDQETITFFSIDPDGVYQVSNAKETLVYQFGNSTETENIFVLNLNVENNSVRAIEFFAPTSVSDITSQQTKLFFLMIISISDDSLNKEEREEILTNIGLYQEVSVPSEYGGATLKNQILYEILPLVVDNKLVGINFNTRIPVN